MGTFHVPIDIGDPEGVRYEAVEALVDTSATYTLMRASVLGRLGVEPHDKAPFELADGRVRDFDLGQTRVKINGRVVTTLVVFGDEDMEPLVGAYTLEGLRLAVDPVRRRLVVVPGRLMRLRYTVEARIGT